MMAFRSGPVFLVQGPKGFEIPGFWGILSDVCNCPLSKLVSGFVFRMGSELTIC
jgi:hypothetical protein